MVQLIKLDIEGFGKFDKEKTIHFKDGINFITGLNEVGKSTILEAIMASIFKYTRNQIEPYYSWNGHGIFRTALTYKTDKSEFFKIITDYNSGKRRFEKIEDGKNIEISTVDKNINPHLKKHFGFDDKKVFENTAFIRQSQIAILEDNVVRNKIKDMMEEVFAGRAEASATKSLAKIKKVAKDLSKEIEIIDGNLIEVGEKIKSAEKVKNSIVKNSKEFEEVYTKLEAKSNELRILEQHYKKFKEKEDILGNKKNINEKLTGINRVLIGVKRVLQEREKLRTEIKQYEGFDCISKNDFNEIKKLINEINKAESSLETHKNVNTENQIEIILAGIKNTLFEISKIVDERDKIIAEINKYQGFEALSESDVSKIKNTIHEVANIQILLDDIAKSSSKHKIITKKISPKYLFLFIIGILFSVVIIGIPLAIYAYKRLKIDVEIEVEDLEKSRKMHELTEKIIFFNKDIQKNTNKIENFDKELFSNQYDMYLKLLEKRDNKSSLIKQLIRTELEEEEIVSDDLENIKKIGDKQQLLIQKSNKISKTISNLNDTLSSSKLKELTRNIKQFDKDNFISKYLEYDQLVTEIGSKENSISELIKTVLKNDELTTNSSLNIEKIENIKEDKIDELAVVDKRLEEYKLVNFNINDFEDLETLKEEVNLLKSKKVELDTNIKTTTSLVESPDDLKEKFYSYEENRLDLLRKIEEYELAAKFLELAESEVHNKFTPAIVNKSKQILKEITNSKYFDLKIQDDTLDIKVKAPEVNEFIDVSCLSQGAKDQLFFALRTVLSDLLSGDTNIPLILDDPFHNFDNVRLAKTIDTIKEIAKNKQIILISHRPYHQEFENFSNNLISL